MFDRVFDENTSQGDVYDATARSLLDNVLNGYNATVFAYGATGCGKTHTITGTTQQPGIIFLTMQELFERISEQTSEKHTEVSLSYLEIYNETIRDLLIPSDTRGGLMLREDANRSVSVVGLSTHHPQSVQEVMDMIMKGNECRTMSPTEANATSSRSHAVLQINVAQKDRNADINEPHTMATLSIIDLAGSERASATKNRGERLIEGANINKSLLALGSCINALCDVRKRNHVPYRNSKLTRLLKFSLGGNCKTVMIVCVSPSSHHFDETQNTLRYANRAKNIQTKVTRNVYNVNRHVKDFLVKIDEQRVLIEELKQQQKDYESIAFAKYKKQDEKKGSVIREGITRLRNAYEHAASERREKNTYFLRLRQVSRRIMVLSSWVAAFDQVCDDREDEAALQNVQAVRKSAQGIMIELEGTRQHCYQKLTSNTWERVINSALENGLRQLQELESTDVLDSSILEREAELLKTTAEREALNAVSEQEKLGDAAIIQMLLQSNFEAISSIEGMMKLGEDEAMEAGKKILANLLRACTISASNVVKPDGNIVPVEAFPPLRSGTPKRRKHSLVAVPTLQKSSSASFNTAAPVRVSSPMKGVPRRRRVIGPKKGVTFTPKKMQAKAVKRSVRWKDDVEDGTLAEIHQTPQKQMTPRARETTPQAQETIPQTRETTPQAKETKSQPSSNHSPLLSFPSAIPRRTSGGSSRESSPLPTPPQPTAEVFGKDSRFKAGFLSKKSSGSPIPPSLTRFSLSPETRDSPLQHIENSSFLNRQSLDNTGFPDPQSTDRNGSDNENWKADKDEAIQIGSAIRRLSGNNGMSVATNRPVRRQSPTATTVFPSDHAHFTASQARRMVRSDKDHELKTGVLSPRTVPVTKPASGGGLRRTTFSDIRPRESITGRDDGRLSSGSVSSHRDSLQSMAKGPWR